jgi:hypothetical protein
MVRCIGGSVRSAAAETPGEGRYRERERNPKGQTVFISPVRCPEVYRWGDQMKAGSRKGTLPRAWS